jgi:hypothetical protein
MTDSKQITIVESLVHAHRALVACAFDNDPALSERFDRSEGVDERLFLLEMLALAFSLKPAPHRMFADSRELFTFLNNPAVSTLLMEEADLLLEDFRACEQILRKRGAK